MAERIFLQCTHHTLQELPNNKYKCFQCKKIKRIQRVFFCKLCNSWELLRVMHFSKERQWFVEYECTTCMKCTKNPKSKDEITWV
jgi:DNA-directed RNA polymerase subunit RPC12/RpoP